MDRDKEQMRACLEEIREKAATMKNGGSWAAGMALLCLGTLPGDAPVPLFIRGYFTDRVLAGDRLDPETGRIININHQE